MNSVGRAPISDSAIHVRSLALCLRYRPIGAGTGIALRTGMIDKPLADRVQALEDKVGDRTIQDQFREQLEAKLSPMRAELAAVRDGIRTILTRLNRP